MATLDERLAAAQAARKAAEAKITESDRAEQEKRAKIAEEDAAARAADRLKRGLELARQADDARERLGPLVHVQAYDAEDKTPGAGTFILRGLPKAECDRLSGRLVAAKSEADKAKAGEDYAIAFVDKWNGRGLDPDQDPDAAGECRKVLNRLGMLSSTLISIGSGLSGLDLEARKS
jgi:hypothetical protein